MGQVLRCLMFGLVMAVIAISVGCGTQAPQEEEEISELPPSTDPFVGTWNFIVEESTPGLGRRSATRTIEDRGDGFMLETWETTSAEGEQAFRQFAAKRDGKDYPVLVLESEAPQSVSIKSIDTYTEEGVEKTDGKVTTTTTRTVSKDGKTMTITVQSANDQGEQINAVAVYERQSTDPSAFIGTWILNVEKSTFDPGPAPKSSTNTIEDRGDGVVLVTREGIDAEGNPVFIQFAAKFDGKDYPFPRVGAKKVYSISYRLVDAYTAEGAAKADGKVIETNTRTVSRDGKTMTFTGKGTNAQGQPFNNVYVQERQ